MSSNLKLSVVMGSYQRGQHILWSLLSLINQEIPPDEIIIIDDGSVDGTNRVIENFQKYYPEANIKYFYNNNPGWTICVHSLNCGIKKATNDIIMLTMPEMLHVSPDVKIIKEHFGKSENDRTILTANPFYEVHGTALQNLSEQNLINPISITKLPNVHEWYNGYQPRWDTITYRARGGEHHIAGILKKHLVAIGGYDEEFLHAGSGYDDIDLMTRLGWYGIKRIRTSEIVGIHLHHSPQPASLKDPKTRYLNLERMQARKKTEWEVNVGKMWGKLKE